jgi:hypothetical protein
VENGYFPVQEAIENAAMYANMDLLRYFLEERKIPIENPDWIMHQAFSFEYATLESIKYLVDKCTLSGVNIAYGIRYCKGDKDICDFLREKLKTLDENEIENFKRTVTNM